MPESLEKSQKPKVTVGDIVPQTCFFFEDNLCRAKLWLKPKLDGCVVGGEPGEPDRGQRAFLRV